MAKTEFASLVVFPTSARVEIEDVDDLHVMVQEPLLVDLVRSAYDHERKVKVAIKKVPYAFEDLIDAKCCASESLLLQDWLALI